MSSRICLRLSVVADARSIRTESNGRWLVVNSEFRVKARGILYLSKVAG